MTLVTYYILPMLLGRTYDVPNDLPGVDIFSKDEVDNAMSIQRYMTDSQYRMVMDSQEARSFLDVSGELSLKIKAGKVEVQGLGSYLRDSTFQSNTVEILVKVNYETETFTLKSTAKPLEGWTKYDPKSLGTHFVRSVTYGGEMVASLKLTTKTSSEREAIRAAVTGNLQSGSGSFGIDVKGNFSKLMEDLKNHASMEIHYYATVPLKGVPSTIEGLMGLVDSFANQTAEINDGLGVPIRMELYPLSALDLRFPRYLETKALTDQIDLLEAEFDDLRGTHQVLLDWLENVPPLLKPEIENKIGAFNSKLESIMRVFNGVIGNMDTSEKATANQFKPAFEAYAGETGYLPDKYSREFLRLRNAIVASTPEMQVPIESGVYTRWGQSTCGKKSELLYSGTAVSTDSIRAGSTQFLCLPSDVEFAPSDAEPPTTASRLTPLLYNAAMDPPEGGELKGINLTCAVCRVPKRTAVTVLAGLKDCPPNWTEEYDGKLMSSNLNNRKGQFECLDETTDDPKVVADVMQQVYTNRVQQTCGTIPCEDYPKGRDVRCVVCSYGG